MKKLLQCETNPSFFLNFKAKHVLDFLFFVLFDSASLWLHAATKISAFVTSPNERKRTTEKNKSGHRQP